jgi:CoA-transferase family III
VWRDLNQPEARQKAYELAAGADVFVEIYRTRKISNLGLSPEELAARRPGIVYASARCYSYERRWDNRAGFDMEALCVTGFTTEEGSPERPAFLPTLVMSDYIAGYLGAAGHPSRPHAQGQKLAVAITCASPCPLRNVVHVPGQVRQERPNAHRRAAPDPCPGQRHRINPLRGTRSTRPAHDVF